MDTYVKESGVATTDVEEMCKQDYVAPSPKNYTDPEEFRTQLYANYSYSP